SATARSSSVIALAIQVTSCRSSRPRSAVTRPPPPRRATRLPSPSRPNDTGPRFETTISLGRDTASTLSGGDRDERRSRHLVAGEPVEEREPIAQQARRQKVAADV